MANELVPASSAIHLKTFGVNPLDFTITNATGRFTATTYDGANAGVITHGIEVDVDDQSYDTMAFLGFDAFIQFPAPKGQKGFDVRPGNYSGRGKTGLQVEVPISGATPISKWQILQAVYDGSGKPVEFAANFQLLDARGRVHLLGEIRFHSDLSLAASVELTADAFQGDASSTGIKVKVQRDGNVSRPLSVRYRTTDYSAVANVDYSQADGTLSWAAGESGIKIFTVPLLPHPPAGDRVFFVNLTGPNLGVVTMASVTIVDNSLPPAATRPEPDGRVDSDYSSLRADPSEVFLSVIVPQADGSALVGGNFVTLDGASHPGILRLDAKGVLDPTFESPLSPTADSPVINAMVVQPDGKLLVAGSFELASSGLQVTLTRLNTDGSVDTSFTPDAGIAGGVINSIALQPDGHIVVAGQFSGSGLARLKADGSLDDTFHPPVSGNSLDYYSLVVLQPDLRMIVCDTYGFLKRLNSEGSVDTSFQPQGGASAGISANNFILQPDGKIILPPATSEGNLIRLNHDGQIDTTFNAPDSVFTKGYEVTALALQANGKLLVGLAADFHALSIARLNADGGIDPTFKPASGLPRIIGALALTANGDLLVGAGYLPTVSNGMASDILVQLAATPPKGGSPNGLGR